MNQYYSSVPSGDRSEYRSAPNASSSSSSSFASQLAGPSSISRIHAPNISNANAHLQPPRFYPSLPASRASTSGPSGYTYSSPTFSTGEGDENGEHTPGRGGGGGGIRPREEDVDHENEGEGEGEGEADADVEGYQGGDGTGIETGPMVEPHQDLNDFLESFWTRQMGNVERENPDFKTYPLPLARIKKVMKSDEAVKMISAEVPIMFSKACEVFISELTCRAWLIAESNKRRTLQKSDVAAAIAYSDMFDFLIDIVPRDDGGTGSAGGESRNGDGDGDGDGDGGEVDVGPGEMGEDEGEDDGDDMARGGGGEGEGMDGDGDRAFNEFVVEEERR